MRLLSSFFFICLASVQVVHPYSSMDMTAACKKLCFILSDKSDLTLSSIAAKIYNALPLNPIEPEIKKILRKNQNGFCRNQSTISQILTICWILEGICVISLKATLLFVDFSKAFGFICREKMEQILLAYSLTRETIEAIMMLSKNTKEKYAHQMEIQSALRSSQVYCKGPH